MSIYVFSLNGYQILNLKSEFLLLFFRKYLTNSSNFKKNKALHIVFELLYIYK